jgi:predicted phosphodiesterase
MDKKHEIIQAIRAFAIELGRAPKRDEFTAVEYTKTEIEKEFGTFTQLLQAAGLHEKGRPKVKIDHKILFYEDVSEQVEKHEPDEIKPFKFKGKILVIGDTHFPFHHKKGMERLYEFAEKYQPDYIIQIGDLLDLYGQSKFPRSQNFYSPEEEEREGVKQASLMWKTLKEKCPKSQCFQLLGNHDVRPVKRVLENAPTLEHVVKAHYKNIMQFEGVTTIDDYRQELIIEDIVFHHGYRSKLGAHRDYTLTNFVCGHSHKGGVVFRRIRGETIWELNAGFLADASSKVLAYSSQKIHDQTLGWGWIDEWGPRFIHL